jgi:hypothetical protein
VTTDDEVGSLLLDAVATGDAAELRAALERGSGLPGARLNLRLVWTFARAVGDVVRKPEPPVVVLEQLLDGWAALPLDEAPGDRPAVVLSCAAVAAYGEVGAVRPDWWDDETAKLRRAASDGRWRVREVVAQALQRLLESDWARAVDELVDWASDDDPLVVRAAAAAVAEPRLLRQRDAANDAVTIQRRAAERFRSIPDAQRRDENVRTLRQALGFTISVAVAASGDFALLHELAASDDTDLHWIVRQNLKKSRLTKHPTEAAAVQVELEARARR